MTTVGWLADPGNADGSIGGAELTQAEFHSASPEGVEIVDCPPGSVVPGLDRYVLNNIVSYSRKDVRVTKSAKRVKYLNDVWPHGDPDVRRDVLTDNTTLIFCSDLHRDNFPHAWVTSEVRVIPPALDLGRLRPPRQATRNTIRNGTCSIASWANPNKGQQELVEWAAENGPVDVYGIGPFVPKGHNIERKGKLDPQKVAQTLWQYAAFVFLPSTLEPFGRSVAEAHFAGCYVTTNALCGALGMLAKGDDRIEKAADNFWRTVCA